MIAKMSYLRSYIDPQDRKIIKQFSNILDKNNEFFIDKEE